MKNRYSIFISYRKVDGKDLGVWLFDNLTKKTLNHENSEPEVFNIDAKMDIDIPGGANWKQYILKELPNADKLIVVCSPETLKEKVKSDWFYFEIKWWLENRKDNPPIIVALSKHGIASIPDLITYNWRKDLHLLEVDENLINNETEQGHRQLNIFLKGVINGIVGTRSFQIKPQIDIVPQMSIANIPGIYAWEKDRFHRYTYANENYAKAAGHDSPRSIMGKTDEEMPWESLASLFQEGDRQVMLDNELARIGVYEKEIMVDKVANILVYEYPIKDSTGRITGVSGCFIDVTDQEQKFIANKYVVEDDQIFLGPDFGNVYLYDDEINVFHCIVRNQQFPTITKNLNISSDRLNTIILSLKKKLQCTRIEDLLVTAIRAGLPLRLFGPK